MLLYFYIFIQRFHSETGDVYTYEDYWLNLDLNHPLGFSVYKRTQYAKIGIKSFTIKMYI